MHCRWKTRPPPVEKARLIVQRAIDEDRLLDLLRGERPYVIDLEPMDSGFFSQNYETMWDVLGEAVERDRSLQARLDQAMRTMTASAPDAYVLAYALVTGLTRQRRVTIPIDLRGALALLQRRLPDFKDELSAAPAANGPMPEGKWGDLKRLQANTGVPLIPPPPDRTSLGGTSGDLAIGSPDGTKAVELEYESEARFGPAFFRARAVSFTWTLDTPIVGEDVHWSSDSRYVVVLVFRSRDTSRPPVVQLLAVDTRDGSAIEIDRNASGLIGLQGFASNGEYRYKYMTAGVADDRVWHRP